MDRFLPKPGDWIKRLSLFIGGCALFGAALACAQISDSAIVYVTATPVSLVPSGEPPLMNPFQPTITPNGPTALPIRPTPNAERPIARKNIKYTVLAGDTFGKIAVLYGLSVEELIALNPGLSAGSTLAVNQVITVPETPTLRTPNLKLIPDSELVNSPAVRGFDVAQYVRFQAGFLRAYSEIVFGRLMSGADIVQMVAQQNSVNPRLLLAVLQYRGGWITDPAPTGNRIDYPIGLISETRKGLFRQLSAAAYWLNDAYYGWKQRGITAIEFPDKSRLAYAPTLNAGTVALQYAFSRTTTQPSWSRDVAATGFYATYSALFGDPFRYALEPLIPANLSAPETTFPFPKGETWFYTGGPHGGWDAASGWAGIDFAPPQPPDELVQQQGACYISPAFATAAAPGLVIRSGDGVVVIDLDRDGDERTGWTLSYLHIASVDSIRAGTLVTVGTPIGHPSCEGFNLSAAATHLHVSRRYNGEWIAADCFACARDVVTVPWSMSGWLVQGLAYQIYQGTFVKDGVVRRAEQGRDLPDNQLVW